MHQLREPSRAALLAYYRKFYPRISISLHHMVPESRLGKTNQYNLYPWAITSHTAWHDLFLNMTIQEVWEALRDIRSEIYSHKTEVKPSWISVCQLDKGSKDIREKFIESRDRRASTPVPRHILLNKWSECFRTDELCHAQNLIKEMFSFMVLGQDAIRFRNFAYKIRTLADDPERFWALQQCLHR